MKKFILAVDSDGCVMDVMNIKHEEFFGPLAADEFNVNNTHEFLKEWNKVNLFSETRGINRFKALQNVLEKFNKNNEIGDLRNLKLWIDNASSLSHKTLSEEIRKTDDEILKKALNWSNRVNKGIEKDLTDNDEPFPGVKNVLEEVSKKADIAIVSSANDEALYSEWGRHGLMQYVKYLYGQEKGNKKSALKDLLDKGYERENILMIGDAPGDEEAAKSHSISFFPVLFDKEKQSWEKLEKQGLNKFLNHEYSGEYNKKMSEEFHNHLQNYI